MVPAGINFIKASSIMWFFSTSLHYSLYFYYKTISFLFQKWFLPKICLLFLVIITMHFRIDKFLLKIVKSEFLSARTFPSFQHNFTTFHNSVHKFHLFPAVLRVFHALQFPYQPLPISHLHCGRLIIYVRL